MMSNYEKLSLELQLRMVEGIGHLVSMKLKEEADQVRSDADEENRKELCDWLTTLIRTTETVRQAIRKPRPEAGAAC